MIAELLYGYGYWGPFLLKFEDARLDCDTYDLDHVLNEYKFLTDMGRNYGYLSNGYADDPKAHLTDVTDPVVLQYYAVEFNHAIKRALYCIVSLLLVELITTTAAATTQQQKQKQKQKQK